MGEFRKKIVLTLFCLLIPDLVWSETIPTKEAKWYNGNMN
jgi:hypothetical protein